MSELYNDLDKIHSKVCQELSILDDFEASNIDKEKLLGWIKEVLLEIKIHLEAVAENKLCEDVDT